MVLPNNNGSVEMFFLYIIMLVIFTSSFFSNLFLP